MPQFRYMRKRYYYWNIDYCGTINRRNQPFHQPNEIQSAANLTISCHPTIATKLYKCIQFRNTCPSCTYYSLVRQCSISDLGSSIIPLFQSTRYSCDMFRYACRIFHCALWSNWSFMQCIMLDLDSWAIGWMFVGKVWSPDLSSRVEKCNWKGLNGRGRGRSLMQTS